MKILISTDTSCLPNYESLNKTDISVFPLNVIIDGEEFLDGVSINQEQLCKAMRDGKNIKTSTPAYGTIIEYFDKLFEQGYDHIIHFTISSKLSSMYSLFKTISEEEYSGKLTIIDSYSLSFLMLSHVLFAYDEVKNNKELSDIVNKTEARKELLNKIIFVPENLNALKNGGRVSPTIAAIANTIGIKPLIVLQEGALERDKMVKNTKNAIIDKVKESLENCPLSDYDYSIVSFDAKESTVEYIKDAMKQLFNTDSIIEGIIPINVCAHCGPGTIGVIVSPKINGKSVKEYL